MREPFADTLLHLIDAARESYAAGEPYAGVYVTELSVTLPLEGQVARRGGEPVFLASAPHTRWRSGVLPPVHYARVVIAVEPPEGA